MRWLTVVMLGLAAVAIGRQAFTQQAQSGAQNGAREVRIAVVNFGALYSKFERVKTFREEMDQEGAPYRKKKEILDNCITQWTGALRHPTSALSPSDREKGRQAIFTCRRELEDLEVAYQKRVGPRFENGMMGLHREIEDAIRRFAEKHRYQLVFSCGEPDVPLPVVENMKRKLFIVDQGYVTTMFLERGVDITREVLEELNGNFRAIQAPVPPR